MMVQAPEEVVKGSKVPTDTHHTPTVTQPSTSSQPQKKQKSRRKLRKETEVLDLAKAKTAQANKIVDLKKRVKKLERKKKSRSLGLKRLYKVDLIARIVSFDEEGLGDQEDASKQGRITEIDADEDLSLINATTQDQGKMNEEDLFRVNDIDGDEVIVDVTAGDNVEQDVIVAKKEVSTVDDEVVTTTKDVEGTTAATTSQISKDDVTLAQKLIEIKVAKLRARGVIVQEPSEFRTTSSLQPSQLLHAKDKEAQMKAEMEEEERIAREKDKTNIVVIGEWDDVQATIDADKQLAEQLQARKREQLSIEERYKLLVELIESRRKHFAVKRAKEIRNKPPIKAQ
nr:hypothetical protein [Tanacetum cinerariifolium]